MILSKHIPCSTNTGKGMSLRNKSGKMQRTALFIVLLFFFSSMSAFSVNATSDDLLEYEEMTHTEPILIDGLPPLMCGDDLCDRPIRINLRTTQLSLIHI